MQTGADSGRGIVTCEHGSVDSSGGREVSVQCSTGPFWAFELRETFDAIAEAGFKDVELMVTRDPETQSPEIPMRLAEERGLRIASVHGPFLVLTKSVWGQDPLEKIRRGTEMCRAFGAPTLIVHPPYLWEQQYATWLHAEAEQHARTTGVGVAVETMYPKWVGTRRLRAYRWLDPRDLFAACHHLVLDTSHLTVAREDIFDTYALLFPKLVHIHLSNNAGDGRDGHLEMDQGALPLDRFVEEVKRSHYRGSLSLELSVRGYLERPRDLANMLAANRKFIEAHLAPDGNVTEDVATS
jgi:sugar phosphate isomerase/epimerase